MGTQRGRVTVVGHKNPDTDSICSAIAYAALKGSRDTGREYIARRAGQINGETQFVLDRFQAEAPEYIADVGTQVSDIQIREVEGVSRTTSLKKAWERMKGASAVTLPVTDGAALVGLITIKDIVTAYMDVYDSEILSRSKTSYANLLETLQGKMVVGDSGGIIEKGEIIVAAGSPDMIEEYVEPHDIVIVSNRYEAQLCAIELEADCLIICNDAPVSRTIQKLARERSCNIISTGHDTYSTARLINQSAPVGYFMRTEGIVTFKLDDFTEDVKRVMAEKRHRDFPVVDRQGHYVGMISRRFLLNMKRKQVILVDHNEKAQAVDGIDEAEILEIIDHHRLASIETMTPVFFRNQPVGCTATIVYEMYREQGVETTPQTAGLLCAAILSDTLMFRSPTCTESDRAAVCALAKIAGIEPETFAKEMFRAGSNFSGKSAEEIFYQDFKKFAIKDISFGVGQINSLDAEELGAIKEKLIPYMEGASRERGLDMVCLMLTNILEEETELLYEGDKAEGILRRAFDQDAGDGKSAGNMANARNAVDARNMAAVGNMVDAKVAGDGIAIRNVGNVEVDRSGKRSDSFLLPGVVSRKKQLIPSIMAALSE